MSEFIKAQTCIKAQHLDCLVKALVDVCPQWLGRVEVHDKPVHLFGYHNDQRADVANVVIRRHHIGSSSNDIGFLAKADGTVEAIISKYDRGSKGFGDEWTASLTQHYAYRVAEKQAAKMNASITKTVNEDGTWRVVIIKEEAKAWEKQTVGRAW